METGVFLAGVLVLFVVLVLILLRENRKVRKNMEILRKQEEALLSQVDLLRTEQEKLEQSKKEIRDKIAERMESEQPVEPQPAQTTQTASEDEESAQQPVFTVQNLQKDILEDMQDEKYVPYWKDPVLNAIFLRKIEECEITGADVTVEGFPEEGIPLPGKSIAEMIALFSNLFDNAIEACMLLPEEERWIRFTVKPDKKKWIFCLENSSGEKSLRKPGEKTSKKNKEDHGIGKDIIVEIVNRNRGWIEFTQEEGAYRVDMMLPEGV